MSAARVLLAAHAALAVFGLAGLLVAVPQPELWADGPGAALFSIGMRAGGAVQNALAAATALAFAIPAFGARRTAVFAIAALTISLAAELLGTATGLPFGGYAYTEGLGAKIEGRVPWSIPLSWLALGLASYALARGLVARLGSPGSPLAVLVGAVLLTAWDLVLDPAMSHPAQTTLFWVWREDGLYLGTPLRNFAGWLATGAAFMSIAHAVWGTLRDEPPLGIPLGLYLVNVGFAAALCLHVGLVVPVALGLALGAVPALVAAAPRPVGVRRVDA